MNEIMAIAKKEFMDNWRNKWIIALTIIFASLTLIASYFGTRGGVGWKEAGITIAVMMSITQILISIIGLMLGYATIVGEKNDGSLLLLLSYPVSRREIIIGKYLGLGAVLIVATVFGFGIAGIVIAINAGINIAQYLLFIVASIMLGLAYLSIAMFISCIVKKRSTAIGTAIFVWFLFVLIWSIIMQGMLFATGHMEFKESNYLQIEGKEYAKINIDFDAKSIAYGNNTVFLLGNKIYTYDLINKNFSILSSLNDTYEQISYGDEKLFLLGKKLLIFDLKNKETHILNFSGNDLVYGKGKLYILVEKQVIIYDVLTGNTSFLNLPQKFEKIAYGKNKLFIGKEGKLLEYDLITNESLTYILDTTIQDLEYCNNSLLIISRWEGYSLTCGDGLIFSLKRESKLIMKYPDWYYITDFFNPIRSYGGLLAINIQPVKEVVERLYEAPPSFYNSYSLSLSMFLWIIIPLMASIYIFNRKDI